MFRLHREGDTVFYAVIFDIGSASVAASIVESDPRAALPKTIFTHRSHIHITRRPPSLTDRMRRIREALLAASLVLSGEGVRALANHNKHARVSNIFITCSSPWSYTLSRTIEYKSETEVKITRELIDDLVKSAENELTTHLEHTHLPPEFNYQIVERSTVNVCINDYPVHDPIGLKGTSISLSHITGLIPTDIIEAMYEIQDKIFMTAEMHAHTSLLVSFCVIRDIYPDLDSFCIASVTAETTEIGIVQNGILSRNMSIPYGINTLVRNIAEETGGSIPDVLSMLQAFISDELNKSQKTLLQAALTNYANTMRTTITNGLEHEQMPETVVLLTDNESEHVLEHDLLHAMYNTDNEEKFTVRILNADITVSDTTDTDPDTYLGLANRFIHKLHGCGEIDSK